MISAVSVTSRGGSGVPEICSRGERASCARGQAFVQSLPQLRRSKDAPLRSGRTRGTACPPPGEPRVCFSSTWEWLTSSGLRPVQMQQVCPAWGEDIVFGSTKAGSQRSSLPVGQTLWHCGAQASSSGRAVVWATRGIYMYKEEPVAFIFKKLSLPASLKHTLIFHHSPPSALVGTPRCARAVAPGAPLPAGAVHVSGLSTGTTKVGAPLTPQVGGKKHTFPLIAPETQLFKGRRAEEQEMATEARAACFLPSVCFQVGGPRDRLVLF